MMLKRHENEAEEADEILAKLKEEEDKMRRISENTNALEENRVLSNLYYTNNYTNNYTV